MSGDLVPPAVADALAHAVACGERNVHVAAYRGDELIVDARIGPAGDAALFTLFATSKAITALAVHLQAERGRLDLDAPLADVWPEYGVAGKGSITPALVLAHRAGVPQAPAWLTPERLGDWESITAALADESPMYPPGEINAYHSLSYGWLLGEAVSRSDPRRRPFARFLAEEVCSPLDIQDLWFGIPADVAPRVTRLDFPDAPPPPPPDAPVHRAVPPAVALAPDVFNRPEVQRACVPAVGAIGDARAAARVLSVFATRGGELLSPERVEAMLRPRPDTDEIDVIYGRPLPVGVGGLWLQAPGIIPAGGRGDVLAHPGAGGTIAWAELSLGLSVAICHDRMFGAVSGHPFARLGDAVRHVAGG